MSDDTLRDEIAEHLVDMAHGVCPVTIDDKDTVATWYAYDPKWLADRILAALKDCALATLEAEKNDPDTIYAVDAGLKAGIKALRGDDNG